MASQNVYRSVRVPPCHDSLLVKLKSTSVTLDEAIEAMRLTAVDMSVKYKETSLSVRIRLSTLVNVYMRD